ncbi:hypothetical protein LEP3755_01440 [Leptolyngbya sp. NIES-3755]|nr:hypothetical protein LEP3755_01440 [Leptolyngbya sp. NIES-3755]
MQAAQQIQRYTTDITRAELETDDKTQAAVLYRILIIGGATKRISQTFREEHPTIPWKEMAGMRDVVSHAYDRVNLNIVWDVIANKVPQLLEELQPLILPE